MDWLFTTGEGICHVCVAGVLLMGGKLLIQRSGERECALPGGHLRFGETTQEALAREFREEMGLDIVCDRLLWTEENFWRWGNKDAHNLGYYYLIRLPKNSNVPQSGALMRDNSRVCFDWLPIDKLTEIVLYPTFLKTEIQRLDGPPKHFVRRG